MRTPSTKESHLDSSRESLYRPILCTVDWVCDLTPVEKLFHISRLDGKGFGHRPGQFVQVSVFGYGEAPISVSSSPTRGLYLELGVRKVGELTTAMHALQPGDTIGIRGPFGTFFDVQALGGKDLLLISGGCGLAPMRALIQYCEDCRDEFGRITVLYGARSPQDLLYKEELTAWATGGKLDCRYTVDEVPPNTSWNCNVGVITTLIPALDVDPERSIAVVVGPPVMYKFVMQELHEKGISDRNIIVSLERHMKCGVGKCGHCAMDHLYCCLDGPVFRLDQIRGVKGALE